MDKPKALELKDNSEYTLTVAHQQCLSPIANKPLRALLDEHRESLLVFPHSFRDCEDDAGKHPIVSIHAQKGTGTEPECYQLNTGNLVGFVSSKGMQLTIRSRFSSTGADGMQDHFLHYMLLKVMNINVVSLMHEQVETPLFDLLPYLFPGMLNAALQQGLYKEYQQKHYNDARLRGRIEVPRHLQRNMPFAGKVAYCTREFSHDNSVTQLIRHTIEHLRLRHAHLLTSNATIRENVAAIVDATPSYMRQKRPTVIRQRLRRHPYYTAYAPLQQLCRSILLHEALSYGEQEEQVHGILVDAAWLWEEYLATLLKKHGFTHPSNLKGTDGLPLTTSGAFTRYPDFYRRQGGGCVLDAKYKRYIDERNDVNQVVTYMYMLPAAYGAFLLPDTAPNKWVLNGYKGVLERVSFGIPSSSGLDFKAFCSVMREQEDKLIARFTPSMSPPNP